MSKNKNAAFTLIELLVVIAVIGLLAAIVAVSVNSARVKARNAKTKTDIKAIITALEMARDSSSNDKYPSSDNTWRCLKSSENCWRGVYAGDSDVTTALSRFLPNIPKTQASGSSCYAYDSYLYHSNYPSAIHGAGGPGAWIIWVKEGSNFATSECPGYNAGSYDCGLYYCFQYIGPN